ncbi:signal peptidase II [Cohaesibacter sp. ES.047]|uniref:signal peptidase II n=1 Tax=Cohaesibacter sp. ES.047 TaxID=1798205 RepID=UPI000BC028BD|nr:signal peptidase II [Cohaesibacter sp. ES.047]SNY92429.1 signal peptidase II [Cohaesibacter sp. ES.047]
MSARQLGYFIAFIGLLVDQAFKLFMLYGFGIEEVVLTEGPVQLTPFLDLILVWNRGISYGLFQQNSDLGRYLLIGVAGCASLGLMIWIWRLHNRMLAIALGLILSGAIGNGIDRILHGAVVDLLHFHIESQWGDFSWYVFNLADCWIVVGAVLLFYDSFFGPKDIEPADREDSGRNDAAKP